MRVGGAAHLKPLSSTPRARRGGWHDAAWRWRLRNYAILAVIALPFVLAAGWLLGAATDCRFWRGETAGCRLTELWGPFDKLFFTYNLALFVGGILLIPLLTLWYVTSMRDRKKNRLEREIPAHILDHEKRFHGHDVDERVDARLSFGSYVGSMSVLMFVIGLGSGILLLFQPAFDGQGARGYANFLLLANGMFNLVADNVASQERIIQSMTAFQFGFLGAFTYFIGQLGRSYFTLDLTPATYVDATIRMLTASFLALVLSFSFNPYSDAKDFLPLISFFFGFFPTRALLILEKIGIWILRQIADRTEFSYKFTPLATLPGMSYIHELRLQREGFDNVENLSHARAVDLAVRTGFTYSQLVTWIEQAWLSVHLREDYDEFVRRTGLSGRDDLRALLAPGRTSAQVADALTAAAADYPMVGRLRTKIVLACDLLQSGQPDKPPQVVVAPAAPVALPSGADAPHQAPAV